MEISLISESQIKQVFSMEEAIESAKNALCSYSLGKCKIPLRASINVEGNNNALFMPGYDEEGKGLGIKIVSVYPDNTQKGLASVPATMVLMDEKSGFVNALLDGTSITRIRTGAAAGAATDLLANKDAATFALFGTGGQAMTQLEAVLCVRRIKKVFVYDIHKQNAEKFIETAKELYKNQDVEFIRAETPDTAVENADIITAVTTAKNPVFDGKKVKKGVHVNSIGSYTPDMCEVDEHIVLNAGKIYVDTLEGVLSESGCILQPMAKGLFKEEDITGELGSLIAGKKKGRESHDEITYFDCVGTAALDIAAAKKVYMKLKEAGLLKTVEF